MALASQVSSDSVARYGWTRAVLEMAVLTVLADRDLHGYAVAQRLAEIELGRVRGGALYPVLGRMEADGLVQSQWQAGEGGPGRKVYSATVDGLRELARQREQWRAFSEVMDTLVAMTGDER